VRTTPPARSAKLALVNPPPEPPAEVESVDTVLPVDAVESVVEVVSLEAVVSVDAVVSLDAVVSVVSDGGTKGPPTGGWVAEGS
jgi:hypothetical protein